MHGCVCLFILVFALVCFVNFMFVCIFTYKMPSAIIVKPEHYLAMYENASAATRLTVIYRCSFNILTTFEHNM